MEGIKEFISRNAEVGIECVDLQVILYGLRRIANENEYCDAIPFINAVLDDLSYHS